MTRRDSRSMAFAARNGFTLLELLLALALSILLVLGLIRIISASSASARLQDNHGQLQETARIATNYLLTAIRQAGFSPQPWDESFALPALGDGNFDRSTAAGDRLSLLSWSDRNCFGNLNPVRDEAGRPRFYIRESTFDRNSSGNLTLRCSYGAALADLSLEIQREGFIPGVESFQVLYGEDSDRDGNINRWVHAVQWNDPGLILGIRVGLLLAGSDMVAERGARDYEVLDTTLRRPADGRLRAVIEMAAAFRGSR